MDRAPSRHVPDAPKTYEPLIEATAARLVTVLGLRSCRYEPFPFDAQLPRIEPGRILLPATEPGIEPWSIGDGVELPVRAHGLTLGRFVLVPKTPTTGVAFEASQRTDAIALAADVAADIAAAIACDSN